MKTNRLLQVLSIVVLLIFCTQNLAAQQDTKVKKGKTTTTMYVEGLSCKNCQAKIEKNIAFEKGVTDLKCDLKTKTVEVTYKTDKTDDEKLVKAFDKIGFPAKVKKDKEEGTSKACHSVTGTTCPDKK